MADSRHDKGNPKSSQSDPSNCTNFTRNLSIPANFKLRQEQDQANSSIDSAPQDICNRKNLTKDHLDVCEANNDDEHESDKSRTPKKTGDKQILKRTEMERRHSDIHLTSKHQGQHHQHQDLNKLNDNENTLTAHDSKPASVSSSFRASDSAFSQSQSTLESDDGSGDRSSSSFSRSLNELTKDTSRIMLMSNNKHHISGRSSLIKEKQQLIANYELGPTSNRSPEGFRMIWRNLSFRVPEKRFSQLNTYWRRYKESIWSQPEQPASQSSPSTISSPNNNDNNNNRNETLIQSRTLIDTSSIDDDSASDQSSGGTSFLGVPRKIIFDNLHGCAESGKLTAILGPSGAGKTTLLNCLTGTGRVKGVSGSILIKNFEPKVTVRKRLKLCIIPQKDYLFDKLTVMENLLFASRLKNTQQDFEHYPNVQRVTNLLGLQSCLDLKTGKLSGGQYKRVSIAQELLSKPDILILDEPTSGLDSRTCYRTVSVLCDLVNMSRAGLIKPLAIIMTIHQPQMKVFNLFHHVYIMSSLGNCIYEGRPDDLIDTVADCCKLLPPPDDLNPASFIIDLASQVYGSDAMEKLTRLQKENFLGQYGNTIPVANEHASIYVGDINTSADVFQSNQSVNQTRLGDKSEGQLAVFIKDSECQPSNESTECDNRNNINRIVKSKEAVDHVNRNNLIISDCLKKCNNHDKCFWLHTWLLVNRLWVAMWRDPLLATTRITFHLLIPFVFYFIYSQKSGEANACPLVERDLDIQSMTSEENLERLQIQHNELILTFENVSLFFLLLYSFSMCVLAITALSFPLNMQILLKETSNGWYSMSRFVMAKTLADLPMELTMPMISVSIAYFLTGQPSSYMCWRMVTITFVMTLCSLISQTQGLLFGAYFMNNVQAAVFISQASSLPWIMLSGFTTRVIELPIVLRWLSFGSIYRLGIESIVAARYGFGMCPCDKELVDDRPAKLVGIPDQLRSVMRYYFEMYAANQTDNNNGELQNKTNTSSDDIFQRLASTISRANTYGAEIVTCHDVRPFIMSARGVEETTLPRFILILIFIFVTLKILLFFVVRLRAGR